MTVGRNDPCPCGSGKRYKHCHGTVAPAPNGWAPDPAAVALVAKMRSALALQEAGRHDDALRIYEKVLATDPRNFDALHMAGVCHYLRGRLGNAEGLITRALSVLPGYPAALENLALVRRAKVYGERERHLCRAVLGMLAPRCLAPADVRAANLQFFTRTGPDVDIIVPPESSAPVAQLLGLLAPTGPKLWLDVPAEVAGASLISFTEACFPGGATLVVADVEATPGEWMDYSPPRRTLVFCGEDAPRRLSDAITSWSADGGRKIEVVFASAALAEAAGIPGAVLAPSATA